MATQRNFSNAQESRFRDQLERLRRDYIHHWNQNDVDLEIAEREAREIQDIEDALEKIRIHKYGVCEGCGAEISLAHLEAIPETRYCGPCLVELESDLRLKSREEG